MDLLYTSVDGESKCRGRAANFGVPRSRHTQTKPLYDNTLATVNLDLVELASAPKVCSCTTIVG
jgi:hypothetical protein